MTHLTESQRNPLTGIILCVAFVLALALSACSNNEDKKSNTVPLTDLGESELYGRAVSYLDNNQYADAAAAFELLLASYANGKFPGSRHLEAASYKLGYAYFQLDRFADALDSFERYRFRFVDNIDPNNLTPVFADDNQYWLAKSLHALGRFIEARSAYAAVSVSGNWAQSAAYQVAKTHYDEAEQRLSQIPPDILAGFSHYGSAITKFSAFTVLQPTVFFDSSQYYQARSYHQRAKLIRDNLLSANPINLDQGQSTEAAELTQARSLYNTLASATNPVSIFADDALYFLGRSYHEQTAPDFDTARVQYNALISRFRDSGSTWFDDAHYQLGKTFYDEAELNLNGTTPVVVDGFAAYGQAIAQFSTFLQLNPTVWVDSGRYYQARSYHQRAELLRDDLRSANPINLGQGQSNETGELTQARNFYNILASANPARIFTDDALYFLGRSYHEQTTPDFAQARIHYNALISRFEGSGSNWLDDAYYQLGKTHYDGAELNLNGPLPNTTDGFSDYGKAIGFFDAVIGLGTGNRSDSARYYKGLSLQQQATLANTEVALLPGGITVADLFARARDAFQSLLSSNPLSIWADNAQFQIGSTHYEEGLTALNVAENTKATDAYNSALTELAKFISFYPASSRVDNAVYLIGLIYHDSGDCTTEKVWFDLLVALNDGQQLSGNTVNVFGTYLTIAQDNHLNLINDADSNTHACPATPSLTLTVLSPPLP